MRKQRLLEMLRSIRDRSGCCVGKRGGHAFTCEMPAAIADLEAELAGELRVCRVCGCHERDACVERAVPGKAIGCHWVSRDLCSSCLKPVEASIDVLSCRARNALAHTGCKTIGQLAQLRASDLLRMKNVGMQTLREIREHLLACGMELEPEIPGSRGERELKWAEQYADKVENWKQKRDARAKAGA